MVAEAGRSAQANPHAHADREADAGRSPGRRGECYWNPPLVHGERGRAPTPGEASTAEGIQLRQKRAPCPRTEATPRPGLHSESARKIDRRHATRRGREGARTAHGPGKNLSAAQKAGRSPIDRTWISRVD